MGGKGSTPQLPVMPQQDNSMMESMMQMMMAMMNNIPREMPEAPKVEPPPDIKKVEPIDWSEAQQSLAEKVRADYSSDQDKKYGIEDTTYTSPLLDDEETTTQNVILGSK